MVLWTLDLTVQQSHCYARLPGWCWSPPTCCCSWAWDWEHESVKIFFLLIWILRKATFSYCKVVDIAYMWQGYFQHLLTKRCDSIHVYVDCMPAVSVEQELFLLQGSVMHALCSVSVISEVSIYCGLTTAGSSAPRSHLLSLRWWDGGENCKGKCDKTRGL